MNGRIVVNFLHSKSAGSLFVIFFSFLELRLIENKQGANELFWFSRFGRTCQFSMRIRKTAFFSSFFFLAWFLPFETSDYWIFPKKDVDTHKLCACVDCTLAYFFFILTSGCLPFLFFHKCIPEHPYSLPPFLYDKLDGKKTNKYFNIFDLTSHISRTNQSTVTKYIKVRTFCSHWMDSCLLWVKTGVFCTFRRPFRPTWVWVRSKWPGPASLTTHINKITPSWPNCWDFSLCRRLHRIPARCWAITTVVRFSASPESTATLLCLRVRSVRTAAPNRTDSVRLSTDRNCSWTDRTTLWKGNFAFEWNRRWPSEDVSTSNRTAIEWCTWSHISDRKWDQEVSAVCLMKTRIRLVEVWFLN